MFYVNVYQSNTDGNVSLNELSLVVLNIMCIHGVPLKCSTSKYINLIQTVMFP